MPLKDVIEKKKKVLRWKEEEERVFIRNLSSFTFII
jgi:hypothetical protein